MEQRLSTRPVHRDVLQGETPPLVDGACLPNDVSRGLHLHRCVVRLARVQCQHAFVPLQGKVRETEWKQPLYLPQLAGGARPDWPSTSAR